MSRARDLGSSINSTAAGKNLIINGGMDIWQRGTSISLVASTQRSGGFGPDRWQMETGASQATTISRQPTNDTANLPNIQYAVRIQRNSGQTGTTGQYFTQTLETSNSILYAGKTVTFSFYARAGANYSTASNSLYPKLWSSNTTNGSIWNGGWNEVSGPTIALTTSWQRFTITGTIGVTQTQIAVGFLWNPTGTAGINDYYEVTGIQLEPGSSATTFSRAGGTIGGELALCQRYYQRWNFTSPGDHLGNGQASGSSSVRRVNWPTKVIMRANPSIPTHTGTIVCYKADGSGVNLTSLGYNGSTPDRISVDFGTSASAGTAGDYIFVLLNSGAYFEAAAEL